MSFDGSQYWRNRNDGRKDLSAVGQKSFGSAYNEIIYLRRLEVLNELLSENFVNLENDGIADIGCGNGFYTRYFRENGVKKYSGLDISEGTIDKLRKEYPEFEFFKCDITSKAFVHGEKFDLIIFFDVLYHIVDDDRALQTLINISGMLENDNSMLIIFDQLTSSEVRLSRHVVFRSRKKFLEMADQAGLEVAEKRKLFIFLVPPVFGHTIIDFIIAGFYKILGFIIFKRAVVGKIFAKWMLTLDKVLIKMGVVIPNHEAIVLKKKKQIKFNGEQILKLHSGIPDIRMYEDLIKSDSFLEIETYADAFLKKFNFLKDHYSWVKDPFHQWSRQWEYPFIYNRIKEYLENSKSKKACVLDAGAGITFFPYMLSELEAVDQIVCQDIDQQLSGLYRQVNNGYQYPGPVLSVGELQRLQFRSNTFDIVYSISVLEHTDNYLDIVKEFHRVLRKNGILILTFDIGLDGVSDISPVGAQGLLDFMNQYFHQPPGEIYSMIDESRHSFVTSRKIGKTQNELLPWKYPFLSLIKSALKTTSIPVRFSKDLTFYCGVFKKI